jgi:hypothetical protein
MSDWLKKLISGWIIGQGGTAREARVIVNGLDTVVPLIGSAYKCKNVTQEDPDPNTKLVILKFVK